MSVGFEIDIDNEVSYGISEPGVDRLALGLQLEEGVGGGDAGGVGTREMKVRRERTELQRIRGE